MVSQSKSLKSRYRKNEKSEMGCFLSISRCHTEGSLNFIFIVILNCVSYINIRINMNSATVRTIPAITDVSNVS